MLEKLKEIIERVNPGIDVSTVTPETKLMEDLKLDSLSIMLLAMEIENAFGFQFTEPSSLKRSRTCAIILPPRRKIEKRSAS